MAELRSLTETLGSLADPTRIRILSLLEEEDLAVHELLEVLGGSQSSLSTHLARLKKAGLVADRREGTRSFYRLADGNNGSEGRATWQAVRHTLVDDAHLAADREKLRHVLARRREESWADRVAGALHRQYIPGRGWESVAFCVAGLLDLGDVVDLGSGDGALVSLLAPQSRSYLCIDLSQRMVDAGKRRLRAAGLDNVAFLVADMAAPPLPDACADTVLLLQSLQYASEPGTAVRAAARLLRKGGRCVILTLYRHEDETLRSQYGHAHLGFDQKSLSAWLRKAGLTQERMALVAVEHRSPHLRSLLAIARR
jgi:DNA-binding transcriptional ArsR family regulator